MTGGGDHLGPPDIKLAGFELWVHGRQFPNAQDYWDANWLNVTAHCCAERASVWTSGSILHLGELTQLLSGMKQLYETLKGEAELPCIEPELYLKLVASGLGQIEFEVNITPNNMIQEHRFKFGIDQSYLPEAIAGCEKVLAAYPVKNAAAI
ncbi:MAG TPA: hypothetical protein VFB93_01615 [Burkholderiales bacterium]|nr:hypothetical protein [Burkholderiales bacterium]